MALTPAFGVSIDADRTEITIEDQTVYGAPNLVRADTSVFFSAAKVSAGNVETDVTTTGDDEDPSTDSSWTHSYDEGDGYWKYRWAVIPEYDVADTYEIYDAVVSGPTVYRSKANANTGNAVSSTVWWEEVEAVDLADNKGEDNESLNAETYVYERVFTSNAQYEYGNLIKENSMWTEADDAEVLREYDLFSLWLNGAIVCDERTLGIQGETICRRISSRFIDD